MLNEKMTMRKSKTYKTDPKSFFKASNDFSDSLEYLVKTKHPDVWFLQENPSIKSKFKKIEDLWYEIMDNFDSIDWGVTDPKTLKKWKWD